MPITAQKEPATWRWNKKLYYQMAEMGWFQDKRVELIEGEIIEMSPIGSGHWAAVNLASRRLQEVFGEGFVVSVQSSLDLGPSSELMPDIAVVPGSARDYVGALPKTAVLVVEVADTSLAYDRTTKADLYAGAGIPEYWIVNLAERQVEVYRQPSARPANAGNTYANRTMYKDDALLAPLAALQARLLAADLLP